MNKISRRRNFYLCGGGFVFKIAEFSFLICPMISEYRIKALCCPDDLRFLKTEQTLSD
ncbi:MAG: hypothetical protein ACOX7O_04600 [Oscillospiraceae bacterium]|jgi:hypothetical protein